MARGRMISKAISLDEKVNALPDDTARLLFTWIIPHLDCEGRLHGDATTIKSIVFPRRNISVNKIEKYLKKMEDLKLILRYSLNGNVYLLAPHFEKHQTGLQKDRETQSQIPSPTPELLQSLSRAKSDKVIQKIKIKSKFNKERIKKERVSVKELGKRFTTFWEAYPKKLSKGQAEKAFFNVQPDDELLGVMLSAIERAKKSEGWCKDNGRYIQNPATWLNTKGWEDEIGGNSPSRKVGEDWAVR